MKINSAEFEISNSRADQCPKSNIPEYAFIGRSNVGKSSLINMLTQRKGLAMTSSTPGKTMLINHFRINDEWYLVDLPGYGYAKRSKKDQEKLQNIISFYVLEREQLTNLFVLIDSRLKILTYSTSNLLHLFSLNLTPCACSVCIFPNVCMCNNPGFALPKKNKII